MNDDDEYPVPVVDGRFVLPLCSEKEIDELPRMARFVDAWQHWRRHRLACRVAGENVPLRLDDWCVMGEIVRAIEPPKQKRGGW